MEKAATKIHPTAIVNPDAQLGAGVEIGPFCIVENDVIIGDRTRIQSHALIASGTRIGSRCFIANGAVLGTNPQDLKFADEKTYLEIGEGTTIREYATLNRGTTYHYKTTVGKGCLLMAYVHVAHDCIIGDNVIISNAVNMAGHVVIDDFAGIGGMTAIHQFVKIGRHCFIGGGLRVSKDVPPYILAMGDPLQYGGVNFKGLSRRGFSNETIAGIKRAYRIFYRMNLNKAEAVEKITSEVEKSPEVAVVLEFIKASERGMIKG